MTVKRRLLAAVTEMGYAHVRRALGDQFELVVAFSMLQARVALQGDGIDAILCSVHFDESRMFDLLDFARRAVPGTPFICCRILYSPLADCVLEGIVHAAEIKGALGFIDYNEMQRRDGTSRADKAFCEAVSALLVRTEQETQVQRRRS
jgi:hypothetical protein